jgi:hypothetical protein
MAIISLIFKPLTAWYLWSKTSLGGGHTGSHAGSDSYATMGDKSDHNYSITYHDQDEGEKKYNKTPAQVVVNVPALEGGYVAPSAQKP